MDFKLTDSEIEVLILIFEGWDTKEIIKLTGVNSDSFDNTIQQIMKKTCSRTWDELRIIGSQLSHNLDKTLQGTETGTLFEVGTKEIFEYLISQAEQTLKKHKETCLDCRISTHGFQINCSDRRRLEEKILEWTGNRNIFEAREKEAREQEREV